MRSTGDSRREAIGEAVQGELEVEPERLRSGRQPRASLQRVVIEVRNGDGPLAGATVLVGGDLVLGQTDSRGLAVWNRDNQRRGDESCIVTAVAPGHATTSKHVAAPIPNRITLELASGGSISGRVMGRDGGPPDTACTVSAWEDWWADADSLEVSLVREASPAATLCAVADDGSFLLSGLDKLKSYAVVASAGGCISKPQFSVVPDAEGLELTVAPLFAGIVRVRDTNDQRPRTNPSLAEPMLSIGPWPQGVLPIDLTPACAVLAGLQETALSPSELPYDRKLCFVYTVPGEPPASIPVGMEANIPGYAALDVEVDCPRASGALREIGFVLQPTNEGFGALALSFTGGMSGHPGIGSKLGKWCRSGELFLRLGDGYQNAVSIAGFPSDDPLILSGIPAGRYEMRFVASGGRFKYPGEGALGLVVTPDETHPTPVLVDLAGSGAVEFALLGEDGREMEGNLGIAIFRGDDLSAYTRIELCADQRILGAIAPGSYSFQPYYPKRLARSRVVEVRAGEVEYVVFRLE